MKGLAASNSGTVWREQDSIL